MFRNKLFVVTLLLLYATVSYGGGEQVAKWFVRHRIWGAAALLTLGALPLLLPAARPPAPSRDPHIMYTRDVHVPGHERPHPELCPTQGAHLALLILVTSAPGHFAQRNGVRLTWKHYAARADVALGFVLGTPPTALRPALNAEDELYGDVIVGRFIDSYSNLTLKTLSMLEWADTYCPQAPRLLKTDDDMFINVPHLLEFAAAPNRANSTRTVWGHVFYNGLPKRSTKSKHYVSPLEFPDKTFPDYTWGTAYLLTTDCVRPLLDAAPAQPYLPVEDVFFTGVLAVRLGIRRVNAPEFYIRKVSAHVHPCTVQRAVSIHIVPYNDSEPFHLWGKLHFYSNCNQSTTYKSNTMTS